MTEPQTARRTLILMRHAAAGNAVRDHDRPLTPDGLRAATEAGRWMRAHLPAVDLALCSTAERTRQTLAAAAVGERIRYCDELYGGGVDDVLEQLAGAPSEARTVLVVGHAPTIPSTAWELVTEAGAADDLDNVDPGADPNDAPGAEPSARDSLRRFTAGSFAVLTTTAGWPEVAETGADLVTVHHPAY